MEEENNRILLDIQNQLKKNTEVIKDLRSKNRRESFVKFLYYFILIIIGFFVWHYLQPFYETFFGVTEKINQSGGLDNLLKSFEKILELKI